MRTGADAAQRTREDTLHSGSDGGRTAAESVDDLICRAISTYGRECGSLAYLAERRYDQSAFPTFGQYDWFAGQVLYCLVRQARPRVVIEFSTSSGYSTTFMAAAVHRNGVGAVRSVDIDGDAQAAAARWLAHRGLSSVVTLHLGDCRNVVPELLSDDVDMVFIDTLHSFDIAEWYLTRVIPRLPAHALVQIHDVMPPEARVRIHGGPPFSAPSSSPRMTMMQRTKSAVWRALHFERLFPEEGPREMLPLHRLEQHPPRSTGEMPTIDGNYFEEAVLIRELLRDSSPTDFVYLHRIMDRWSSLSRQRYASTDRIGRSDNRGVALEWNDALWARAGALVARAKPVRVAEIRRRLARGYAGERR